MNYTIATLGSHSALQILKGAKDEGFKTLVITTPKLTSLYDRYSFIDKHIEIENYTDVISIQKTLKKQNVILIPHGSFVAYLGIEGNNAITLPYFGSKSVLDWEADRQKQRDWLEESGLTLPRQYTLGSVIDFPVIVKSYGAAGGSGYFIAKSKADLKNKMKRFGDNPSMIQEYIVGAPLYIQYFYSPLTNKMEILGMDRRYETNADGIGRLPALNQPASLEPSFVVIGNSPLVLRESMLEEAYRMGENVVAASKKMIDSRGLYGPFCLETIITPDMKFSCIEISCRIVAGTNMFIDNSPYASLLYDEPMSMGRRIAREIKQAISLSKLPLILN